MAKLTVQTQYDTYEVALRADVTIGRSRTNSLRIDGPQVSRNHAVIFRRDNIWQVRDLDSKNGLYVNGISVSYSKLNDGDEITIGEFRIRFSSEANSGFRLRSLTPAGDVEDHSEDTSGQQPPKSAIPYSRVGALASTSEVGTSMGPEQVEMGGTGVSIRPNPLEPVSIPAKPEDIFFRLEDVESMIDRWDGTSPNQFLSESLGLHKRLMNSDKLPTSDFNALVRHLLFSLAHAVGATRGVVLRREPNGLLTPLASEPSSIKLTVSRIVADAALRRLCTLCTNCGSDERFRFSRSIHSHNVASLLCVPTVHPGEVTGMIYLDTNNAQRPFRREHLHLAAFIGRMVQMFEDLQVAASGNPVTPIQEDAAGVLVNDSADAQAVQEITASHGANPYQRNSESQDTEPLEQLTNLDDDKSQSQNH